MPLKMLPLHSPSSRMKEPKLAVWTCCMYVTVISNERKWTNETQILSLCFQCKLVGEPDYSWTWPGRPAGSQLATQIQTSSKLTILLPAKLMITPLPGYNICSNKICKGKKFLSLNSYKQWYENYHRGCRRKWASLRYHSLPSCTNNGGITPLNDCNLSFIEGKLWYYEVNVNNSLTVSVIKRATKLDHHM